MGRAEIRPLAQLVRLGGLRPGSEDPLSQLDLAASAGAGTPLGSPADTPRLSSRWVVFELERCGKHGRFYKHIPHTYLAA